LPSGSNIIKDSSDGIATTFDVTKNTYR
jgi:hypothetical protein